MVRKKLMDFHSVSQGKHKNLGRARNPVVGLMIHVYLLYVTLKIRLLEGMWNPLTGKATMDEMDELGMTEGLQILI